MGRGGPGRRRRRPRALPLVALGELQLPQHLDAESGDLAESTGGDRSLLDFGQLGKLTGQLDREIATAHRLAQLGYELQERKPLRHEALRLADLCGQGGLGEILLLHRLGHGLGLGLGLGLASSYYDVIVARARIPARGRGLPAESRVST